MNKNLNSILNLIGIAATMVLPTAWAQTVLRVEDVLEKTVQNSYTTRLEHANQQSRNWEEKNALAQYAPNIHYEMVYMRMDGQTVNRANEGYDMMMQGLMPPGAAIPANPNALYENSFSHKISLSQPITNGGAELTAIKIAKHTQNAVGLQSKINIKQAQNSAYAAYLDWLVADHSMQALKAKLQWAQDNLQVVQQKVKLGALPVTEQLQWQAQVLQEQAALASAESGVQLAIMNIWIQMGESPEKADSLVVPQSLDAFVQQLMQQIESNPTLVEVPKSELPQAQMLEAWHKAAQGYKDLQFAGFLPKINAFAEYSWPAHDAISPNTDMAGWTAGVVFSIPLWSGFRNTTSYKKAVWDLQKSNIEKEQSLQMLAMNTKRLQVQFAAAQKNFYANQAQRELMIQTLNAMQQRYDAGQISILDLEQVANQKQMVEVGYVQSVAQACKIMWEYKAFTSF